MTWSRCRLLAVLAAVAGLPGAVHAQVAPPAAPPSSAATHVQRAPDPRAVAAELRRYRQANERRILRELVELLRLPNVASDSSNIRRNAHLLVRMLERRGIETRILEHPASAPAVYGELRVPGATRTVVLYAHYDGQPVRPADWASDPWTPTFRDRRLDLGGKVVSLPPDGPVPGEWRVYARSASDDKSPIVAMLTALDGLRASGRQPAVNLKFFFEGAEEAGSPGLRELLTANQALLRADLWLFADGPVHQSGRRQLVYGVRGITSAEITVYGPARPLHSGHYGNWAPNPASLLVSLLASMRDADGRILIDGYMSDVRPPTPSEVAATRALPSSDSALRRDLALGGTEAGDAELAERLLLPALNIRGLAAGGVGDAAVNAIPTHASASLDFRLVPDQAPARVREVVTHHVRAQGYHVVSGEPGADERRAHRRIVQLRWSDDGYAASRMSLDAAAARAALDVLRATGGGDVLQVPTLGGSLPLAVFEEVLGAQLLTVPMVNHDNNQHAANENLRLQNLWDGIELYGALMAGMRW